MSCPASSASNAIALAQAMPDGDGIQAQPLAGADGGLRDKAPSLLPKLASLQGLKFRV